MRFDVCIFCAAQRYHPYYHGLLYTSRRTENIHTHEDCRGKEVGNRDGLYTQYQQRRVATIIILVICRDDLAATAMTRKG